MKKAIIILSVFAVMVGAMIAELIFVNKFYNSLQAELEVVAESIELNESNVSNAETVALCEKVAGKWEKGKRTLLMLQNHNTVRNLYEKIVSLMEVVKSDNYNDAVIFAQSAINFVDDILLDSMPYLTNLL